MLLCCVHNVNEEVSPFVGEQELCEENFYYIVFLFGRI